MKKLLSILLSIMIVMSVIPLSVFSTGAETTELIPSDAVQFNGHAYKMFDNSLTWTEAENYCENLGGHLATITSQEEQNFLIELTANSTKKNMWIGAKLNNNGIYAWVTGEDFSYTNWAYGEPNNVGNEQYTAMMYTLKSGNTLGLWNDENENGRNWTGYRLSDFGFICEWDNSIQKIEDGFNFYMNYPSNYLNKGDNVKLHIGYYLDGSLDSSTKEYIYTVSDSSVIKVGSSRWNSTYGQYIDMIALKEGSATITVTHPVTGESSALEIYVIPREFGYNFYNIPEMSIEVGKTTNFYNFHGLVIDNFSYTEHKNDSGITDYYTVTMNVYNANNLYGAVTAYDKSGNIESYCILDKLDTHESSFVNSCKSLYYSLGDCYYLLMNEKYYSGQSVTKKTEVMVNVPVGGHISISNNSKYSEISCAANTIGLLFDSVMLTYDFATMNVDSEMLVDKNVVIKELIEELADGKSLKYLKEAVWNEVSSYDKVSSFSFSTINKLNSDLTKKLGIDLNAAISKTIDGALSATESIVKKILPTGQIIDIMYSFSEGCNIATFLDQFLESFNVTSGINIYAPVNPSDYFSNGIDIISENDYTESVIHAYTVIDSGDAGIRDSTFSKKNTFYSNKYQTYNITMYKNGIETQPESVVTVRIPIPSNFNVSNLEIYRNNDDGSLTDMNAYISGNYIVFETDHFSYYSLVDESDPIVSYNMKFSGASISLQDDLSINYKVEKSLFEEMDYQNPYVIFEFNGKEYVKQNYKIVDDKYVFTFNNISPNQINDNISATLYATYDDIEYASETRDYSVSQYCYNMLGKCTDDKYAEFRTLLVDLLNYGAQSQLYTNYNTENLANAQLTDTQKAWGTQGEPTLSTVQKLDYEIIENPTVAWKGGGLRLEDSVTMRFIIEAESIDNLTVKVETADKTYTIKANAFKSIGDNRYYVYFNGLNASQMSEEVYLTVYNGEEAVSNTLRYSIESYAYAKAGGSDTALSELVIAMMKYGNAAYNYVN